jgi:hypothetical protein
MMKAFYDHYAFVLLCGFLGKNSSKISMCKVTGVEIARDFSGF